MLLKEHLTEFTKDELFELARIYDLKKCSKLRKVELIDRITDHFCTEEMMRKRFACLTKEQMELFQKACAVPQIVSMSRIMDAMQLYEYLIGYFEEVSDDFCVFEDVAVAFNKINDDIFWEDQYKKGWMVKCVQFFSDYYGIAPIEMIYEMYKQKIKCPIDTMTDILMEMPIDIVESCIVSMEEMGMVDWSEDDPVYSKKGLLVHISVLSDDDFDDLLKQQMGKDFFIPTERQIDEIYKIGYESSSFAYRKLESFFMKKVGLSFDYSETWCLRIWANSHAGESPSKVINEMEEVNIIFDSEQMVNEFIGLLMNAHNNTRMKENRGHTPNELSQRIMTGKMPTIVPGSSDAAAMLKEAETQLRAMGIPLDLERNADTIDTITLPSGIDGAVVKGERKIYPNDPCPCGSGKKYKKCCGKNKEHHF